MNNLDVFNYDTLMKGFEVFDADSEGYEYRKCKFSSSRAGEWILRQSEAVISDYIVSDNLKMTFDKIKNAKSETVRVAWLLLCCANRGDILGPKIKQHLSPELSVGVPGILGVAKRLRDIPYSRWDLNKPENKDYIGRSMNFQLGKVLYNYYGRFEELRNKFGQDFLYNVHVNHVKSYRCSKTDNSEFDKLPLFLKFMLSRSWVWANSGSKMLVYNTDNLDAAPHDIGLLKLGTQKQEKVYIEDGPKTELPQIR